MAWLLVVLLGLAFAALVYAGMRYQRPAVPRSTALLGAAIVFAAIAGWSGFATWASTLPGFYGEWE